MSSKSEISVRIDYELEAQDAKRRVWRMSGVVVGRRRQIELSRSVDSVDLRVCDITQLERKRLL